MALVQATLKNELIKVFDKDDPAFVGFPNTVVDAATNFGNAYNTYAIAAQDASGDLLVTANLPGFISTLAGALPPDPVAGTSALAANAFGSAFVTYWTAAVFGILIPLPAFALESLSVVSTVIPTALSTPLKVIFDTSPTSVQTAAIQADLWANAFHTATLTVIVMITGTNPAGVVSSIPGPIS